MRKVSCTSMFVAALLVVGCGGPEDLGGAQEAGGTAESNWPLPPPPRPLTFPVVYQRILRAALVCGYGGAPCTGPIATWRPVANAESCTSLNTGNPYLREPPSFQGEAMTCEQLGEQVLAYQLRIVGGSASEYAVTVSESTTPCRICPGPSACCFSLGGYGGYGGYAGPGYGGTPSTCYAAGSATPIAQPVPYCTVDVQPVAAPAPTPE